MADHALIHGFGLSALGAYEAPTSPFSSPALHGLHGSPFLDDDACSDDDNDNDNEPDGDIDAVGSYTSFSSHSPAPGHGHAAPSPPPLMTLMPLARVAPSKASSISSPIALRSTMGTRPPTKERGHALSYAAHIPASASHMPTYAGPIPADGFPSDLDKCTPEQRASLRHAYNAYLAWTRGGGGHHTSPALPPLPSLPTIRA